MCRKNMDRKTKKRSLLSWLKLILTVLILCFSIFLLVFITKSRENLLDQEISYRKDILKLNVDNVNSSLEALESYLYQNFTSSEEIVRLETGGTETQEFMAAQELSRTLQKIVGWNKSLKFLFLYVPVNEEKTFIRVAAKSGELLKKESLELQIREYIDEKLEQGKYPGKGYLLTETEDTGYLIRFYKIRNSYVGLCVSGDSVLQPLEELANQDECYAFLCDLDGNVISATDDFRDYIDFGESDGFAVSDDGERYLQLSYLSRAEDFYIGTWTRAETLERQIQESLQLFILFVIVAAALMICMIFLAQRFLYRPITKIEKAMKQVRKGEWDLAVHEDGRILEYDNMIRNFNQMVSEIKDLKIKNYEKELSAQRTYLQYLQLQVNPHFYLNALNIIYSLAQVGNCPLIQEMTLSLVDYSRYMFREPGSLVTVQQEMEHVENYMKIQRMRFPDRIDFRPSMSSEIDEALIPPFIIQSFVENSIKYAVNFEQKNILIIHGNINEIQGELYVQIEIRDNGTGYSQEVLELINTRDEPSGQGVNRVGIRNVKQRLKLVFGDRAKLLLENDDGAVTRILIPLMWKED